MPPRRSCFLGYPWGVVEIPQFQCHHGVPASLDESPDFASPEWGFNATTAFLLLRETEVASVLWGGFNATTAFLLHGGLIISSRNRSVSMPPRRSCFRTEYHNGFRYVAQFQCHHGVPAFRRRDPPGSIPPGSFNATTAFLLSSSWPARPGPGSPVSMPPRRSCFLSFAPDSEASEAMFQCHHGVPAFLDTTASMMSRRCGFNATTAFLLSPRRG